MNQLSATLWQVGSANGLLSKTSLLLSTLIQAISIRFARFLVIQCIAVLAIGCTTISVESDGKKIEVIRHVGVAYVVLPPRADTVTEIRSLGFSGTSISSGFGFIHQRIAALHGDCRLVIWIDDIAQLEAAIAIATSNPQICVISEEAKK